MIAAHFHVNVQMNNGYHAQFEGSGRLLVLLSVDSSSTTLDQLGVRLYDVSWDRIDVSFSNELSEQNKKLILPKVALRFGSSFLRSIVNQNSNKEVINPHFQRVQWSLFPWRWKPTGKIDGHCNNNTPSAIIYLHASAQYSVQCRLIAHCLDL